MATYYVDDDGSNTDPFDTLAKAATTLAGLLTAKAIAAGDLILIRSTHLEGGGALTIDETTGDAPYTMISIDAAENYETMATGGGKINSTGQLDIVDSVQCHGIAFESTGGHVVCNNGADTESYYKDCTFTRAAGSGSNLIYLNNQVRNRALYDSCTFTLSQGTNGYFPLFGTSAVDIECRGCDFHCSGQTTASFIFRQAFSVEGSRYTFQGCDISDVGVNPICDDMADNEDQTNLYFRQCNLKSGFTLPATAGKQLVVLEDCAVGTIAAPAFGITDWKTRFGNVTHETTSVRTDGAANHGVTYSHKFVSTAAPSEALTCLRGPRMVIPVAAGSQTLTVHVAGAADINDDDLWIEVLSPSEEVSETAQYKFNTTRPDPLATPVALTRDSTAVWGGADTGTDGGAGQQKIDLSINPAQAGKVIVRACLSKPSTTHYVCPKIEVA